MNAVKDSYERKAEIEDLFLEDYTSEKLDASGIPFFEKYKDSIPHKRPMWRLNSEKITLTSSKPIGVKISRGETSFFADNETLDIYAIGDTIEDAINDFCIQLLDFYEHYYTLDSDQANSNALKLKNTYLNLFTVSSNAN